MTRCYSKTIEALDSYTKLLIHGDSIGDATGKTVTANGNAAVTTAQYKFAELGRSLVFDGTEDYLSTPHHDDFDFGTGDFTIDCWVRLNAVGINQMVYAKDSSNTNRFQFILNVNGRLLFVAAVGGPEKAYYYTASGLFSINTWYHIALVRSGSNIYMFVDGVSKTLTEVTAIGSNTVTPIGSPAVAIGASNYAIGGGGDNYWFNGWIDEFRISKGIARWTSDFTPPTAPYDGARTVINITGLDGNTDEEYELTIKQVAGAGTVTGLRFNNDSGTNYGYQMIYGQSTTAGAERYTDRTYIRVGDANAGNSSFSHSKIYSKSGYVRTCIVTGSHFINGTTIDYTDMRGYSWNNTADNITSLVIAASQTNGLGVGTNIELYKKSAK